MLVINVGEKNVNKEKNPKDINGTVIDSDLINSIRQYNITNEKKI